MLRTFLVVYPAMAMYVVFAGLIFIPITWVTGRVGPLYQAATAGIRFLLWLAGIRVELTGLERACRHPVAVFVCNHVSAIDPPALFMILPRVAVMLKKSLRSIPILGHIMTLGEFVYVDRSSKESRQAALEAAVETLRGGLSMLIFPEGTRSPDGRLLPFHRGGFTMAIQAQVPIVPITITGTKGLMSKGSAAIRSGPLRVFIHDPVPTAGLAAGHQRELMNTVRQAIESALPTGNNSR